MKTFKEFLEENMTGKQIPLKLRKTSNGQQIFCPKCGFKFVYYKEKTKCRGCGQHIINDLGMPNGNMMEASNDKMKDNDYKTYFEKMLKKWKIDSPSELSKEDKKKFYDEVDAGYKTDKESD